MVSTTSLASADADDAVDIEISACLNPESPRSFFLYAGAGSGKTYSLVKALKVFEEQHGPEFRRYGKRIAIITYTNAARDEIDARVRKDPLFHIRTIHSFCWEQIETLHTDIRSWLLETLPHKLQELVAKESRGRVGTQASMTRQKKIASVQRRLDWLSAPRRFTYSPDGGNSGRASLSHNEVLVVTATFLTEKPSMQELLVKRYPFLLIDESQDTNRALIEAFFALEQAQQEKFGLGLIGDMMQRIYGDGKVDLDTNLPEQWATPVKRLNRRCPTRIIALANDVRADSDGQVQKAIQGARSGHVHLFIASAETEDKTALEETIRERMAQVTTDAQWTSSSQVKTLTLEHLMSAKRMGFSEMLTPLLKSNSLSTPVLDGSSGAVNLFATSTWPLLDYARASDGYGIMSHLRRKRSPLLDGSSLISTEPLAPVREAVDAMVSLIGNNPNASFFEVLTCISRNRLFQIPKDLEPFVPTDELVEGELSTETQGGETENTADDSSGVLESLGTFLETPFSQIQHYISYISETGAFDTHQGVKGREFERVLVVMDDSEARGFNFSYEKLFAVVPQTANDERRRAAGEDTNEDRTRRLFYVTCTRAEKSLALVAYTADRDRLSASVLEKGWFESAEITIL